MQQHAAVYMAHVLLDILEHHRLFLLRPKLVSVMKVDRYIVVVVVVSRIVDALILPILRKGRFVVVF